MQPGSIEAQLLLVSYVCLSFPSSKSVCSGLLIQCRHRGGWGPTPPTPPVAAPLSPGIVVIVSLFVRSMTVRLWRVAIPLSKLALEKASVDLLGRSPQKLENAFSMCLTDALDAWISGPANVRGNIRLASKVGYQVL
jgi:hypothetical protein